MSFNVHQYLIKYTKMEMRDATSPRGERNEKCDASTSTHLYRNLELAPQQPSAPSMYNALSTSGTTSSND
jgi:hypothetical protein